MHWCFGVCVTYPVDGHKFEKKETKIEYFEGFRTEHKAWIPIMHNRVLNVWQKPGAGQNLFCFHLTSINDSNCYMT